MLVRCKQWINENFAEGSRPHPKTVKEWVEQGAIEGRIINGHVYVQNDTLATSLVKKQPDNIKEYKLIV